MKRLGLILALFAFFFIIFAGSTSAFFHQGKPRDSTPPGILKRSQDSTPAGLLKKEEKEQAREVRQATQEAQRAEKRIALIRALFERMARRLRAAITRLEILIVRIESRVARLEAAGENMATISASLAETGLGLDQAGADLAAAEAQLEDVLTSSNPKEAFKEVRSLISGVKEQLKDVHRALVHLIGDIRGLRVGQPEASPSPSPTASPTATPSPTPTPTATP